MAGSFDRQEINDGENNDWIFWPSDNEKENISSRDGSTISIPPAKNESECTFNKSISPEIKSVSYMSDQTALNATIWLSSQLLQNVLVKNSLDKDNFNSTNPLPLWHKVKFTMAIDIFSTFNQGVDYRIEFFGDKINSSHNQWKKEVYEISADGTNKKISDESLDKFPYSNKEFVEFFVNLKSISNPQKYRILFYITDLYVKDGKLCRMVDSTNWILSPPPEFNILVSPNSIFMRPEDKKDIIVTISGNTDLQSKGKLDINYTNEEFADINFLSNETVISSFANGSSIIHIDIPNLELNTSKHLFASIIANISFPTIITNKDGETFYNNKSISLLEYSNLVLTILPSLTWTERIDEFAKIIRPIGELWGYFAAIGTAIISLIFFIHRKGNERNAKSKDNNDKPPAYIS